MLAVKSADVLAVLVSVKFATEPLNGLPTTAEKATDVPDSVSDGATENAPPTYEILWDVSVERPLQLAPSIVYEPPAASVGAMLVPPFTVVHVAAPVTPDVAGYVDCPFCSCAHRVISNKEYSWHPLQSFARPHC